MNPLDRIHKLQEVLHYTREFKPSFFNTGERIMIHQEIAAWYGVMRRLEEGENSEAEPRFVNHGKIFAKIEKVEQWLAIKNKH